MMGMMGVWKPLETWIEVVSSLLCVDLGKATQRSRYKVLVSLARAAVHGPYSGCLG